NAKHCTLSLHDASSDLNIMNKFSDQVRNSMINPDRISDTQFSAMVSLAYNIGISAFKGSTLLRKVNANPCDPTIPSEFLRWNKAGGKVINGLTRRRQAEADLYTNG